MRMVCRGLGQFVALSWVLCLSAAAPLWADGVARPLDDGEAARWRGVGVLYVGVKNECSAALISPTEAITAAHCVYGQSTRSYVPTHLLRLVLGPRGDVQAAVRGVRAVAVLPGYRIGLQENDPQNTGPGKIGPDKIGPDKTDGDKTGPDKTGVQKTGPASALDQIASDMALLELDAPVSSQEAVPFDVADWSDPVASFVDIVGYEHPTPLQPMIREGCTALDTTQGVTSVNCQVVGGLSGAPVILRLNPDDPPQLVAEVSSRAKISGQALALVVSIAPHLAELRGLIAK